MTISAATHHSALRLQPLRGHRGHRLARGRAAARQRARRERRARRQAGHRPVHQAREVRRGAEAGRARGGRAPDPQPARGARARAPRRSAGRGRRSCFAISARRRTATRSTHFAVYVAVIGFFKARDALKRLPALIAQAQDWRHARRSRAVVAARRCGCSSATTRGRAPQRIGDPRGLASSSARSSAGTTAARSPPRS